MAAAAIRSQKGVEDLALVRRSLGGDRLAQEQLAERLSCLAGILRHRNQRLSSPLAEADFQDLVQDTALALWRKLDRFDGRASLETWAYRFCTFQMMSSLRDFKRKPTLVEDFTELDQSEAALQTQASTDPTVDVEYALELLEASEVEVVRGKHFEGMTFESIGERLGISSNTVKTRYYRAILKLRDHLSGRYPELFGENRS